ncbi:MULTISPECIES: GNAT family N-acetyltransferase [unclassified Leptotrichia]|uniref:GNAT family N-acetyltransferase n=1 Tax=unclassified Leptotrichia TaxID=2633022 RepID=UPI0003AE6026|nr:MULTISPECIES: GNAT family N-acetyltransferase [unclassified Leptotrichia]ERL25688.1 cation diffusion facilitator family transporter [Leptotrichia sp. oral taxon 225 str. F0581]WLD75097.1 GNAT family N-acetyltransferase [Leptotrichia sp. HMT-225]
MKVVEWDKKENISKILIDLLEIDPKFSFDKEKDDIFFLYNNGELCGYVILILNNIAQLKKIFILPKLRNNGYGTFFLKYIINWITNKNFDSLIITNHKKMNNFLEKQRFIKTEDGYILNNLTETKRQKKNMLSISKFAICVNIVLALLKIMAGKIFYSMSLLSDGLNSLSDLITNVLVIVGLKVGSNPEDKEHPFGHGKIESVFSVIIGTFIMITAFELIKDNFSKLTSFSNENNVNITLIPIVITVLAILIKIFQLTFMKKKAKKYNNALINSLLADYNTDIVISSSVLFGLLLSRIHPIFDTIVGFIVSIYIIKSGYELIKENSLILMDSQDDALIEKIRSEILQFEEIENAHDFRMTTSGKDIYMFVDVRMDKNKTIEEAHDITNKISKKIKHKYKNIKRFLIHIEPVYEDD